MQRAWPAPDRGPQPAPVRRVDGRDGPTGLDQPERGQPGLCGPRAVAAHGPTSAASGIAGRRRLGKGFREGPGRLQFGGELGDRSDPVRPGERVVELAYSPREIEGVRAGRSDCRRTPRQDRERFRSVAPHVGDEHAPTNRRVVVPVGIAEEVHRGRERDLRRVRLRHRIAQDTPPTTSTRSGSRPWYGPRCSDPVISASLTG